MSDLALAVALADYRRSFLALGEAFIAAAGRLEQGRHGDRLEAVAMLERELATRDLTIDLLGLDATLICATGLLTSKTGKTPRELHDLYWKAAPSDEEWQEILRRARDRRGGTE